MGSGGAIAVVATFNALMVLSRAYSGESTQNSCEPIQNVSFLPPSMMSRISGYQHVTGLYVE
jgi:hypothetical protein